MKERNPILIAVIAGLLMNAIWAVSVYAWQAGVERTHDFWKQYGAGIAAEAYHTNNPDKLREIIAKVQDVKTRE